MGGPSVRTTPPPAYTRITGGTSRRTGTTAGGAIHRAGLAVISKSMLVSSSNKRDDFVVSKGTNFLSPAQREKGRTFFYPCQGTTPREFLPTRGMASSESASSDEGAPTEERNLTLDERVLRGKSEHTCLKRLDELMYCLSEHLRHPPTAQ